jgi:alkyldihydroxyacetonephosphate synthase
MTTDDRHAAPTPPIPFEGAGAEPEAHLDAAPVGVGGILGDLQAVCREVLVGADERREAGRDWWPLALHWALRGQTAAVPAAVCRPADAGEVAAVLRVCHAARVPVTAAGGRSGVCGASVPVFGGVVVDLTAMQGIVDVDATSGLVTVLPGTFGHVLEAELAERHGLTVGHWPQSMALSTVGGWVACRGAGQLSTRYGKIEDMVVSLDVVLPDGRPITVGRGPRAAAGPDLLQLFVGSEGTLGVVTGVTLRAHPVPEVQRRAAYGFGSFADGLEACRRILRRGATPAVLRLYDEAESKRSHGTDGTVAVLLVLDEGDGLLVDAVMAVVAQVCADAARLDDDLVERWWHHRNDVSALQALTRKGFVVDTLEIAAPWSALPAVYDATTAALLAVPSARAATAHLSHSYPDGACLYFTFAATSPPEEVDATYLALWDAGTRAVLAHGGNLSHHHGVGLNRSRFVAEALGPAFDVLVALKDALDPAGIANPGKLGLPSPFGTVTLS